jgi:hypothetical protein
VRTDPSVDGPTEVAVEAEDLILRREVLPDDLEQNALGAPTEAPAVPSASAVDVVDREESEVSLTTACAEVSVAGENAEAELQMPPSAVVQAADMGSPL